MVLFRPFTSFGACQWDRHGNENNPIATGPLLSGTGAARRSAADTPCNPGGAPAAHTGVGTAHRSLHPFYVRQRRPARYLRGRKAKGGGRLLRTSARVGT